MLVMTAQRIIGHAKKSAQRVQELGDVQESEENMGGCRTPPISSNSNHDNHDGVEPTFHQEDRALGSELSLNFPVYQQLACSD